MPTNEEKTRRRFTPAQEKAIEEIRALLEIEARTSVITRKARNQVMQRLDPADLAAIATEITKLNI
jgi:hypothetical protein